MTSISPSCYSVSSGYQSLQPDVTLELYFQVGFHREAVYFLQDQISFSGLLEKACLFVENQFSNAQLGGRLIENIFLFLHDLKSDNILRLLKSSEDLCLKERDVIEIVLSSTFCDQSNNQICQHDLDVHSFHAPAFCDFCGEMLWGIVRQGLRCKGCGQNYHKRCAYKIPNDCSLVRKRKCSSNLTNDLLSIQDAISPVVSLVPQSKNQYSGRPIWIDTLPKIKVPHTFEVHTFKKPTRCSVCRKILLGVYKQGLQCKDCKLNCHKKCQEEIADTCPGEEEICLLDAIDDGYSVAQDGEAMEVSSNNGDFMEESAQNIPLMRVFQSIRQKKTYSNTVLKDGWLFHFSDKDALKQRRRHFWRLDTKAITLYRRDTGSNYFKEIPLSDILYVAFESHSDPSIPHYSFRIQTRESQLFVGDESGTDSQNISSWYRSILKALKPVEDCNGEKTPDSVNEVDIVTDISQIYQIHPDEILGSGQFGTVYGGKHRKMGFDVAVKVVNRVRFEQREEDRLRREVEILQGLDNPGIVKLFNMHETPEKVFVVMEKLRGDMLEMILSSEKKRLSERMTKFLTSQILVALQYLHRHDIVHCDLKPENVLISSDDPFPQLKLCDFGFARIIGRKSFRRSMVGTPAYLAPEVLHKECFNRSLDMWSVGVIVYVSLSGTFPFNEDEDINQQIQNAHFMYPPNPWNEMSSATRNFIESLLRVNKSKRLSVDKALEHTWMQDFQTWLDLRILETNVGERYLTHSSDDDRWSDYAGAHGISLAMHQLIL